MGKKGGRERLQDTNVPLLDLPEADAAGAPRGGPGGHECQSLENLGLYLCSQDGSNSSLSPVVVEIQYSKTIKIPYPMRRLIIRVKFLYNL